MTKTHLARCPSSWRLERYHFGYLEQAGHAELDEHLLGCPQCQVSLRALQEEVLPPIVWGAEALAQEDDLLTTSNDILSNDIELASASQPHVQGASSAKEKSRAGGWWWFGSPYFFSRPALASGILGLLLLFGVVWRPTFFSSHHSGRLKGTGSWVIYVHRHQKHKVERVYPRDPVHAHDTLRFHFELGQQHVMVLSLNEKGEVSLYFPYPAPRSFKLPEGPQRLPKDKAIPLDGYVGQELFVMLAASRPFSLERAREALLAAFSEARGDLSRVHFVKGFSTQRRLLITKVK